MKILINNPVWIFHIEGKPINLSENKGYYTYAHSFMTCSKWLSKTNILKVAEQFPELKIFRVEEVMGENDNECTIKFIHDNGYIS